MLNITDHMIGEADWQSICDVMKADNHVPSKLERQVIDGYVDAAYCDLCDYTEYADELPHGESEDDAVGKMFEDFYSDVYDRREYISTDQIRRLGSVYGDYAQARDFGRGGKPNPNRSVDLAVIEGPGMDMGWRGICDEFKASGYDPSALESSAINDMARLELDDMRYREDVLDEAGFDIETAIERAESIGISPKLRYGQISEEIIGDLRYCRDINGEELFSDEDTLHAIEDKILTATDEFVKIQGAFERDVHDRRQFISKDIIGRMSPNYEHYKDDVPLPSDMLASPSAAFDYSKSVGKGTEKAKAAEKTKSVQPIRETPDFDEDLSAGEGDFGDLGG